MGATIVVEKARENFRTVIPGLIYRSGQLSDSTLRARISACHLRSVINLRGKNADARWWRHEAKICAARGVHHYDFSTDSICPPNPDELAELIPLLTSCEKPVLIHCQSGIDRTGVVSAICLFLFKPETTPASAQAQLGLSYGHLWWRDSTKHHRAFFALYEIWLERNAYQSSADRFSEWALHVYDPPLEIDYRAVWRRPEKKAASLMPG
jgi:protein tyrosine phosphatase (PTP) superfamily phosphohydrolase (DUF442 family)